MSALDDIARRLEEGDDEAVASLVRDALGSRPARDAAAAGGSSPAGDPGPAGSLAAKTILDEGLLRGMASVGKRFREHEIFLPDVLLAAKAMYAGLALLEPHLAAGDVPRRGTVVLGTVQGDLHDIGKNLVGIMLRGAGFEVVDLGNDVAPERFVGEAQAKGAGVIGMSALLTTTMPVMRKVVELVRERGLAGRIRILAGGAPVTDAFAREIGADAHGYDAAHAAEQVERLLGAGA